MCERTDAIRTLKEAAMGLSEACLEHMRVPGQVSPLVKLYDDYVLQQDNDVEMAVLIGKIR